MHLENREGEFGFYAEFKQLKNYHSSLLKKTKSYSAQNAPYHVPRTVTDVLVHTRKPIKSLL